MDDNAALNYRRSTVGLPPIGYTYTPRSAWGVFTRTAAQIKALDECPDTVELAVWGVQTRDAIRALPTFGGARC